MYNNWVYAWPCDFSKNRMFLISGLPKVYIQFYDNLTDYEEVPVSQELVLVNGEQNSNAQLDMQKMLREQLDRLEHRYQEKIDRIKKVCTDIIQNYLYRYK